MMKDKIVLRNRHKLKCNPYPFHYSDKYISNGKFLLDRDIVKNDLECCVNVGTKYNIPEIDQIANSNYVNPKTYIKTKYLYDMGFTLARIFEDEETKEKVYIDEMYVKDFGLTKVIGKSAKDILYNEDRTIFIMGMRKKD